MDFDKERELAILKAGYRWSGIGFSVYGLMMSVGCVTSMLWLGGLFFRLPIGGPVGISSFDFWHSTLRAWTRVFATGCIFLAWTEPSWRRRSGLLLLLSVSDLALWFVDLAVRDGYLLENDSHPFLRSTLMQAMGWARFGLISSLVGSLALGVNNKSLEAFSKTARATASVGTIVWFFYFLEQVDWRQVWPLRPRPFNAELLLLMLVFSVMTTVCLIQASYMCLVAGRESSITTRAIRKEESNGPWGNDDR